MASMDEISLRNMEVDAHLEIAKATGDNRFLVGACLPPNRENYDEEPTLKEKHIAYVKQFLAFFEHQSIKEFDSHLSTFPWLIKPVKLLAEMLKRKQITPKKCRSILRRVCHEELLEAFERTPEERARDEENRMARDLMKELRAQERAEHPERFEGEEEEEYDTESSHDWE